ncbi:MAG: hypothetical protein ACHQUA_02665 [Microgenomates group bacterium]
MVEHRPEKEFPCECPSCGVDLQEPGNILVWFELPGRMVGHLEPGEDGKVNLAIDKLRGNPEPILQCGECGEDLNFEVDDLYLDPFAEDEDGELLLD